MKQQLRGESARMEIFQIAMELAPHVMMVVSENVIDCRVLYVNKMVAETLGYGVETHLGR